MKQERSTYDRALTLLQFRARSEAELRRRLLRAGEPGDAVDETIVRLRSLRLLDDDDFARQFARTRMVGAGESRRRIIQQLGRKGVARDVAERAISEVTESEAIDTGAAAHAVAIKKWKSLASLDPFTRKRRLYAFLARRGFDPDEIRDAMRAIDIGLAD